VLITFDVIDVGQITKILRVDLRETFPTICSTSSAGP